MKKWLTILCSLLCVLCLSACEANPTDVEIAQQKAKIDQYKIQLVTENAPYYVGLIQYLNEQQYTSIANYNNDELESYLYSEYSMPVDGHGMKTVMESFRLTSEKTGAILSNDGGEVQISNVTAEIKGNQILVHAQANCEKGTADVELIFSNDLFLTLKGGSLNAKATMGDLMSKAALNTLIGMGTVFAVLILISLIIACFGIIPKIQESMKKKEEEKKITTEGINNAVSQIAQQEEILEEAAQEDDTELVAVIAAAIAAYEGSTNTEGFVVRSIRRR